MRRITVLLTAVPLALSGLAVGATSNAEIIQDSMSDSALDLTNAKLAAADHGAQNSINFANQESITCTPADECVAVQLLESIAGVDTSVNPVKTNHSQPKSTVTPSSVDVQNSIPNSYLQTVSCPSSDDCVAAGSFENGLGGYDAFTKTQTKGVWGVDITATFDAGVQSKSHDAYFESISCAAAGECVAAGRFENAAGDYEAFTQSKTNGAWASAKPARFAIGTQSVNPNAYFDSVFCAAAGDCVAAGRFENAAGGNEAFTQTQTNGIWATATPATFATDIQSAIQYAFFTSTSCSAVGECVAAGAFENSAGGSEAFTQTQTKGAWATAVPASFATDVQSSIPSATFESVSCPASGECVAAGTFENTVGGNEAFTQTQTKGAWATAVPASFATDVQSSIPSANFESISCPAVGECVAAGKFENASGDIEAFTQSQDHGVWASALPATFGIDVQSSAPYAYFVSVSCLAAGACVAAGTFESADGGNEAFTQSQTNGVWAIAKPVKINGVVQNSLPDVYIDSISCTTVSYCTAVGRLSNVEGNYVEFTQNISH